MAARAAAETAEGFQARRPLVTFDDCPGSRLPTVAACEVALAWAAPLASVGRAGADKNGEKNGTGGGGEEGAGREGSDGGEEVVRYIIMNI